MTNYIAEKYVIIGKLGKTFGINGWLNLYSYTNPKVTILDFSTLYLETTSGWEKIYADNLRRHRDHFVIHMQGIDNLEDAKTQTGKKLAVLRHQLPKLAEGEYYWCDLIGLTVINTNKIELGVIDHLFETGANDVIVVVGKKRHLIPYISGKFVLHVDLEVKIMVVDWDENF